MVLEDLLRTRDLTQASLARYSQVSKQTINQIVKGTSQPTPRTLEKVAGGLSTARDGTVDGAARDQLYKVLMTAAGHVQQADAAPLARSGAIPSWPDATAWPIRTSEILPRELSPFEVRFFNTWSTSIVDGLWESLNAIEFEIAAKKDLELGRSLASTLGGARVWLEMLEKHLGIWDRRAVDPREPSLFDVVDEQGTTTPVNPRPRMDEGHEPPERLQQEWEVNTWVLRRELLDPERRRRYSYLEIDDDALAAWARGDAVDREVEQRLERIANPGLRRP